MSVSTRKFLIQKTGIVGLILSSNFCTSCQSSSIRIQPPPQDHFTFSIDSDGLSFGAIPGFSYSGPLSTDEVEVQHTFFKGLMTMEISIVDINPSTKSFSLFLSISRASVGEMVGTFSFLS